jgi:hypothetical protein
MRFHTRALRIGIAGLTLFAAMSSATIVGGQALNEEDTTHSVQRKLERLPYYGVFDYIAFGVRGSTVKLVGYSFNGSVKAAAEMAAKRASGVEEVLNEIEVLPASINDDRIRWATFYQIYTDDFLSRYVPGGAYEVLREIRDEQQFPGMQPIGTYPIHIIVKNGRTTLLGTVDSPLDRQLAEVRAREVTGVFGVENRLNVARQSQEGRSR